MIDSRSESTTGSRMYTEQSCSAKSDDAGDADARAKALPETLGENSAMMLLEEVKRGGYVDSSHQALALTLCALSSQDGISQLRTGPLTPHSVEILRLIQKFLKIKFKIAPEQQSRTLFLSCIGAGIKNLAKGVN